MLERWLDERWEPLCAERSPGAVALREAPFRALSRPLRALAVRRAVGLLQRDPLAPPGLTRRHYDAAARLPEQPVGAGLSLPGGFLARREHGLIYIARAEAPAPSSAEATLPVPGSVSLREPSMRIAARAGPWRVYVAAEALRLPLSVRTRRPGDRFRPLGAPGERKLKAFFIGRKVPRHQRDRTPLVADASGRIVWVVGHEIADHVRLTGRERRAVRLEARPVSP